MADTKLRKFYKWYVKTEYWRNQGTGFFSTVQSWLSVDTMYKAFTGIALAKLTILQGIPIVFIMVIVFILGIVFEVAKIYLGYLIFKKGWIREAHEWSQKNETLSPFNFETTNTLKAICDKLGIKHSYKES